MTDWTPIGMTVTLAMTIAATTAYISGRVHGWTRQDPERRFAYCKGYDVASSSMLTTSPAGRKTDGKDR